MLSETTLYAYTWMRVVVRVSSSLILAHLLCQTVIGPSPFHYIPIYSHPAKAPPMLYELLNNLPCMHVCYRLSLLLLFAIC
ncbi:hypothetical protein VN97_g9907 [Penicillium thymicola]|uniref:Uncharacterized protein n=1 Tax=Penicillium thymicola TaxID=293382 RepID=A0AAI9TA20_PENTH|nr:hypothetical protein VN97_g9907 [Penicillium thymicola]